MTPVGFITSSSIIYPAILISYIIFSVSLYMMKKTKWHVWDAPLVLSGACMSFALIMAVCGVFIDGPNIKYHRVYEATGTYHSLGGFQAELRNTGGTTGPITLADHRVSDGMDVTVRCTIIHRAHTLDNTSCKLYAIH